MKSLCFFLLCCTIGLAQKGEYSSDAIPGALIENANAVVRLEEINIDITSRSAVTIRTRRIITVYNEFGLNHTGANETRNVKSISATVYNSGGVETKKFKRKDFKEVAVSEGSIISDNKTTYLDYTPTQYPFTMVYESEVTDGNTGFLPAWLPVGNTAESIEKASITITCAPGLGLKYMESNFDGFEISKEEQANGVRFTIANVPALKLEQYAPIFRKIVPRVLFGLEKFSYEGVNGEAVDWKSFGKWVENALIAGTTELPQDAKDKIIALVGTEKDAMKKARIVYDYVQSKTRYVSIQLGVGGWKPMKVADVHRLGYGDCKALTNYTKALLDAVGVPSYYCLIYGGGGKTDLEQNFVSMQGNHATLAIPDGSNLRWVECTSQTSPFDFQANFTDDRLALVLKPDGGELVRTNIYKARDNSQLSVAAYTIQPDGQLLGKIEIKSRGTQYDAREELDRKAITDRNDHYKEYFSKINNLKLDKIELTNNKLQPEFTEKISVSAAGYATISGNRLIFAPNAFNQFSNVPQRYRNRTSAVEIDRGFYDADEFTIAIPDGFTLEAKPADIDLNDVFGVYKVEYKIIDPNHILYKRSLLLNQGYYPATDYEKFRKFAEQIAKSDNAKCVLIKT
jgi:hypothetical protein